jgi:hypothetical protein
VINAQRLVDAINDILEHPEKHKQGSWMEVEPQEAMKNAAMKRDDDGEDIGTPEYVIAAARRAGLL